MNDRQSSGFHLPGMLRHDFFRKIIAVIFAVIVYWKVSQQIGVEDMVENVRLDVVSYGGIMVLDENVRAVKLMIKAKSKGILNSVSPSDFKLVIEIPDNYSSLDKPFSCRIMDVAKVTKPSGVEILGVRPDTVSVRLDRRGTADYPVKVRFSGSTQENYACGEVVVDPPKATVSGPMSLLRRVSELQTEPVILDKKTVEDFECGSSIVVPEGLKASPDRVKIQVEIYKKLDTREFKSLPLKVMMPPDSSLRAGRISPTNADVSVQGMKNVIEVMDDDSLSAYVDASSIKAPGTYPLKAECHVGSAGVKLLKIFPEDVSVEIKDLAAEKK